MQEEPTIKHPISFVRWPAVPYQPKMIKLTEEMSKHAW